MSGHGREATVRELTVAGLQMMVSDDDVAANERTILAAVERAATAGATFLLTPEGSLSGYRSDFDRFEIAAATDRIAEAARDAGLGLLLGTCYKEVGTYGSFPFRLRSDQPFPPADQEVCYNQVRVYTPEGDYLGFHSKTQLVTSSRPEGLWETRNFVSDPLRTFDWNGIRFGILICNDLWGGQFSSRPNNLAHRLHEMGAEILFHSVFSGYGRPDDLTRLTFLEANQQAVAGIYRMPVVTVNAADDVKPLAARSGIFGAPGDPETPADGYVVELDPVGEQFFVHTLRV